MTRKPFAWRLCIGVTIVLCVLCYSPLVIPAGVSTPVLMGVPRSLWLGLLLYVAIVVVTLVAARVHPDIDDDEGAGE